jgi:hypothetical protein
VTFTHKTPRNPLIRVGLDPKPRNVTLWTSKRQIRRFGTLAGGPRLATAANSAVSLEKSLFWHECANVAHAHALWNTRRTTGEVA